jgi:tetratricopeptide (TPR) repeat protein
MDVVVGQPSSNKSRGWLTPLKMGIIAGILAVLLLIVGMVLWQQHQKRNSAAAKIDAVIGQSEDAYLKAEFVNALNIVKPVLATAKGKDQQTRAYQAAAQAAAGSNRLEDAVKYYEKKHEINKDSIKPDAYTLGSIYERLEKKDQAIAQYKIALEYAKTSKNQYGSDVHGIQASIDALEGKEPAPDQDTGDGVQQPDPKDDAPQEEQGENIRQ